ncbi:MAG: amidase [Pseudorhodobacter sp.]|jgi:amidase
MNASTDKYHAFMPYAPVAVVGQPLGPLAGLSFAVKDIFDVVGYRTGCGCPLKLAASPVKDSHAVAVQQLLDAGAVFKGKTHTDELAWSMYGMNAHFGTPINPAAPNRIPGGSSSGSAVAVASGQVDFSIGTDTGGSVRAPASFCGIWGLRPSHGSISLTGCMDLAASFDTCGLFARDAKVLARAASVLIGSDGPTLDTPAFLWPSDMAALLGPEQLSVLQTALRGHAQREVSAYGEIGAAALYTAFQTCVGADIARSTIPFIFGSGMPLARGIDVRAAQARDLTEPEVLAAQALRDAFTRYITEILGQNGVLLAPTVHDIPFKLDAPVEVFDGFRHLSQPLLSVAGMAGLPQVSMPAGVIEGAPFGVSLIGPKGSDLALIALAQRLQSTFAKEIQT